MSEIFIAENAKYEEAQNYDIGTPTTVKELVRVYEKSTSDASTQTSISLPCRVAVQWHCHCPDAATVVDMSDEQAEEEIQDERINPEEASGEDSKIDNIETMADTSSVTAGTPRRSTDAMLDIAELDLEDLKNESPLKRTPDHDTMVSDLVKVWEKWSLADVGENVPKDLGIEMDDVTMSDESGGQEENLDIDMQGEDAELSRMMETIRMLDTLPAEAPKKTAKQIEERMNHMLNRQAAGKTTTRQDIDHLVAGKARVQPARKVGGARFKMARGMTVDSGAADNVMPRRMVRGKGKVRSSPGSRARVHYVAASDQRIANEGETDFSFSTLEGQKQTWVFQIAQVNKVLCAVSYLVDNHHRVIFDQDERTGIDTSHILNKKTGVTIKMKRERNVWTIEAFVEDEDEQADFARRG